MENITAAQILDDFDYLGDTLSDWCDKFGYDGMGMEFIENEYLPRFERAIWRLAQKMSKREMKQYMGDLD